MAIDTTKYVTSTDENIVSETIIAPSTLEIIDRAMFDWVNDELNIFCTTNKGWKKAKSIWVSAERAHQVKNKKELRDSNGALILPLITVQRDSVTKDPDKKGIFQGHVPPGMDERGGSIIINKRINQDKTANFANADAARKGRYASEGAAARNQINFPKKNKKIVYQVMSIPMPVYVDISYKILLRSEYQQQMNEMTTPFITRTGGINHFILKKDGHRYEAFIQQDFSQDNNVSSLDTDERMYETTVEIKVLGYLIGEGKNQERPKVVIRENAVEVKIPKEQVIFGDIPEHIDKRGFYRD
tara:strand:+ start:24 stop:923 length:900 start_codon:yes stop_codon:yes gene_type:complete